MNAGTRIRVGVIGATGYIGKPYRQELRECNDVDIVALCARRHDLLEQAKEEDGAQLITNDWRDVVAHDEVNFVIVATPDALHYDPVIECAREGKHLLCEKPVGMDRSQSAIMWKAYQQQSNLSHFVPFWTRYADIFVKAKEIVDSGQLGTIRGVVYRWHNPRPPQMPLTWRDNAELSAGGSIADVGSHAYDTVRWLIDDEASNVLADAGTITGAKADLGEINLDEALQFQPGNDSTQQRVGTTPDYASIAWRFHKGATGVLVVSHAPFFRKGLAPELELHGTDASLAINRVTGELSVADSNGDIVAIGNVPDHGFGNRFRRFVIPVVQAAMAQNENKDHPSLYDGWRVQCFTDAAAASARSGSWQSVETPDA